MCYNQLIGVSMPELTVDAQVGAIRAFNRFYTRKIGVVDGMASSPFALAEARVLYELAHREQATATDIRKELGLDAGYMSRILREFERRKLIRREQSKTDERQKFLSLTAKGRRAFAPLDARSNRDVVAILEGLSPTSGSNSWMRCRRFADCLAIKCRQVLPICCDNISRATWAGSCIARQFFMPKSMDGMEPTRRWQGRSWRNSSRIMIRIGNAAGSRKRMERESVAPLSLRCPTTSRSCACCMLKRKRAGWESASALLRNAFDLRGRRDTRR